MEILDDADRERPYDMETYKKWLKLGEEDPYFNKAMCKYLAQAEKGIEMGEVVIKTMEELEQECRQLDEDLLSLLEQIKPKQ